MGEVNGELKTSDFQGQVIIDSSKLYLNNVLKMLRRWRTFKSTVLIICIRNPVDVFRSYRQGQQRHAKKQFAPIPLKFFLSYTSVVLVNVLCAVFAAKARLIRFSALEKELNAFLHDEYNIVRFSNVAKKVTVAKANRTLDEISLGDTIIKTK